MVPEKYWLACEIEGEKWFAETDGHWLVMSHTPPPEGAVIRDNVLFTPLANIILSTNVEPAANDLVAGLRVEPLKSCEECDGTGILRCDDCEGRGDVDCECTCGDEHEADCDECDGQGKVDCECVPQGPRGKCVPARIAGLEGAWDRRLLTPLLDALGSGLSFGTAREQASPILIIRGKDKWAALMGLHVTELPPLHVIGIQGNHALTA